MKKIVMRALGLALAVNLAFSFGAIRAHAEGEYGIAAEGGSGSGSENNALKKLCRGACNVGTCVLEVPAQMGKVNEESGPLAAGTWGLVKGISCAGIRMLAGAYEIVTFPIPFPPGYKPVLDDPEFFYSDRTW